MTGEGAAQMSPGGQKAFDLRGEQGGSWDRNGKVKGRLAQEKRAETRKV